MPIRNSTRAAILFVAGALILLAAIAQGMIFVPHVREDMLEIGMRPTLFRAISLVLYFSVVAMFAFAALVLTGALSLMKGQVPSIAPLLVVAAIYLIFGLGAFFRVAHDVHFLGYAMIGLLVAMGVPRRVRTELPL